MHYINDFYSLSIHDVDLYHVISVFFIISILGWLVESIYMSICNRKLTNRGFIKGPICPIYGGAASTIYFLLAPLDGNYVAIYFVGVVVSTAIEYLVAQIMIYIFDEVWWDYNDKPFNYKGVICLESSIAWGFYCVMLFGFLYKVSIRFVDFYTEKIGIRAGMCIVTLLIVYYVVSFVRAVNEHNRKKAAESIDVSEEVQMQRRFNGNIVRTIRSLIK